MNMRFIQRTYSAREIAETQLSDSDFARYWIDTLAIETVDGHQVHCTMEALLHA